ncbi:MAG: hypothetical protein OXC11_02535 [Rhodospirillales bacterium]|nr:hypothetical protein [Rhodospirillales bacterium]
MSGPETLHDHAEERRRLWVATAGGVVVAGLVLVPLVVAYEIALDLLHDLKVHLGYEEELSLCGRWPTR